ncbi:MAG: Rne/Rng family ribonuclease [Rhodospirillales bacterium]|nr:Rne/Rng family ribonuclease [Rhodospirillales bacterium]MCB9964555.1 Rne/Rng family ribonuclease [Rhodospirillales bacterium]
MTKRMLIDATHPEETRIVVADNNQLIDYEYESAMRKQLRGNIFLAKVTRVEPSLQAAFVNYGGNRHGFLPFSEIHTDYYRIPVADREALLEEQRRMLEEVRRAEEEEDAAYEQEEGQTTSGSEEEKDDAQEDAAPPLEAEIETLEDDSRNEPPIELGGGTETDFSKDLNESDEDDVSGHVHAEEEEDSEEYESDSERADSGDEQAAGEEGEEEDGARRFSRGRRRFRRGRNNNGNNNRRAAHNSDRVEMVGGDSFDGDRPLRPNLTRRYKIQEVVKRGQIMLVQVSKEERGNKGAAVTSYLSLPGRYCVLMPNSPRGGGVSRKIANYQDRRRLREILKEFNLPEGMSVIVRTAGVSRTKVEIKRDLDYLLRLWDNIRTTTLESQAPAMIYEEGDLVKRAVRDIYNRDMEEIYVEGDAGYKTARDMMKMMIPSHVKRVKQYKDHKRSLFQKFSLEQQISGIGDPQVPLKSGGYLVIHPTEALVSVDVNSGRATKERHIEETALRTNLEAAEEVARQLRLRDLGGLVVIDFIDMEDRRNNAKVERKLKEALSSDRARLQVGRISSFGLLELSRQRISASVTETQFQRCDHCDGTGFIRTVDSMAILVLRALESMALTGDAAQVAVKVTPDVALYILNKKRHMLVDIENRYEMTIFIHAQSDAAPSFHEIDVLKTRKDLEKEQQARERDEEDLDEDSSDESAEADSASESHDDKKEESSNKRRRDRNKRRRDRTRRPDAPEDSAQSSEERDTEAVPAPVTAPVFTPVAEESPEDLAPQEEKPKQRSRRRKVDIEEEASAPAVVLDAPPAPVEEAAEAEKPKRRGRKPKAQEEPIPQATPPSNDDVAPVSMTATAATPVETPQTHARAAEVVNEAPAKKKRGWWNKLVE